MECICDVKKIEFNTVENEVAIDEKLDFKKICNCTVIEYNGKSAVLHAVARMYFIPNAIFDFKYEFFIHIDSNDILKFSDIKGQVLNIMPSIARDMVFMNSAITSVIYRDPFSEVANFNDVKFKVAKGIDIE